MESNLPPRAARTALSDIEGARARVVRATRTPRYAHAAGALLVGVFVAFALLRLWGWAAGVGVALFVVSALRWSRRRGKVTDDRALRAQMGRYFLWLLPIWLLAASQGWWRWTWWAAALAGVATAACTYAYLRSVEHYQERRLARGDYQPWDIG